MTIGGNIRKNTFYFIGVRVQSPIKGFSNQRGKIVAAVDKKLASEVPGVQ